MKARIRVPTTEYAFIEAEFEGTAEQIVAEHDNLQLIVKDKEGVSASDWVEIRKTLLNTGEFDPNRLEELSKLQRFWVNQTKLGLRSINKIEE